MKSVVDLRTVRSVTLATGQTLWCRYFRCINFCKGSSWASWWVAVPCEYDGKPICDVVLHSAEKPTRKGLLVATDPLSVEEWLAFEDWTGYLGGDLGGSYVDFNRYMSEGAGDVEENSVDGRWVDGRWVGGYKYGGWVDGVYTDHLSTEAPRDATPVEGSSDSLSPQQRADNYSFKLTPQAGMNQGVAEIYYRLDFYFCDPGVTKVFLMTLNTSQMDRSGSTNLTVAQALGVQIVDRLVAEANEADVLGLKLI